MALIDCAECGNLVSNKATACPKCGAPVDVHSAEFSVSPDNSSNESRTVESRAALTQASVIKDASELWVLQMILAAAVAGIHWQSWWLFGGVFTSLILLSTIPIIGPILGVVLAAACGIGSFWLVSYWSLEAGYVLGGLVFVGTLAANIVGTEWFRDLDRMRDQK